MGIPKKVKYKGSNPQLINGASYTYNEYAMVAGVTYRCFSSRATNKQIITDRELQPHNSKKVPKKWRNTKNMEVSNLETFSEEMSQEWLSKKL